jgi:hypothetical protein
VKRRDFVKFATATAIAVAAPFRALTGRTQTTDDVAGQDLVGVDPYFLESGEIDAAVQGQIEDYLGYRELISLGESGIMPRGGRPDRAPTYRFMRWDGDLGDPLGRFKGPFSSQPVMPRGSTYQLNAQILGFHAAAEDWPGKYNTGTLSVEIRTRIRGESMTWLYAQQFELFKGGISSLGLEYIGQRDGVPSPIATDDPNLDLRIQLMRSPQQKGGILGTVFKVASIISGGALGGAADAAKALAPPLRVPQMVQEGVAFSQAVFGGTSDETPLWRSGFTSYAIAEGGSRLGLVPGLWVALDEARRVDLRSAYLDDVGGRVALLQDGEELDVNYLVLALEMRLGPLPDLYYETPPASWENDQGGFHDMDTDTLNFGRGIIKRRK